MLSIFGKNHIKYNGQILPPKKLRFGGKYFEKNKDFINSGKEEVRRLIANFNLSSSSSLLEIGCGPGRLPIGILATLGELKYEGIDIHEKSIIWCKKYIEKKNPSFNFHLINIKNERYNPFSETEANDSKLPVQGPYDIIYLYSVFSHLLEKDIRFYLNEFKSLLLPEGNIFLTAFIKDNVPPISINPENYIRNWQGPLHCVRYNKEKLFLLFEEFGFQIDKVEYEKETDNQSGIYLS